MLVSVIVPIYNVKDYLLRCLNSLDQQDYENLEILLVDDGSKDESGMMADEYCKNHSRFRVLHKPNGGLSDARNYGMKYALGEAFAFVDSDDWVSRDYVSKMVESMKKHNSDVVCCDMEYVDDDGNRTFSSGGDFSAVRVCEHPEIITINNSACNKLIRKHCFHHVEFPKGIWYEDLGSIPMILAQAKCVSKVSEHLYFYYQRSGSISHTENMKIFDIYTSLEKVRLFLEKTNKPNEMKKAWMSMYVLHGADLTTLRISQYRSEVRIEYMKKNMELLNHYYPKWISDSHLKVCPTKKKVLFHLLNLKQLKLVDILLHRKDKS